MWSSCSVVIPVYNSMDSLDELYDELSEALKENFTHYEIILVDDCSKDDSFIKMKELYYKNDNLKIIKLQNNYGQQNAIKAGFEFAKGDYFVTMDDDLQHQPKELIRLVKKLDAGYDVVYGVPQKKEHVFYRNVGSKLTNLLFNTVCHKPKEVRVSSFRCFRKSILEEIKKDKTSFVYLTAMILKITNNIGNVYVDHRPRKYGKSNYNFYKLLKLFIKLFVYYSDSRLFNRFIYEKPQFEIKEKYL